MFWAQKVTLAKKVRLCGWVSDGIGWLPYLSIEDVEKASERNTLVSAGLLKGGKEEKEKKRTASRPATTLTQGRRDSVSSRPHRFRRRMLARSRADAGRLDANLGLRQQTDNFQR